MSTKPRDNDRKRTGCKTFKLYYSLRRYCLCSTDHLYAGANRLHKYPNAMVMHWTP